MSYKVICKEDAYKYDPPGHFDVLCTRLHNPTDVNEGKMTMGLSHFQPGGGCTFGNNPFESIYYIISGQMTLKTDNEEIILQPGDTFHCGPGTNKSVINNGTGVCQMLVVLG